MGATLPAISRWVEATPEGVSWLGFFYGGNIAGAVVGSVLAGFYLLRVFDVSVATYVAVAINVVVALGGLGDREGDAVRSGRLDGLDAGRDPRRRRDERLRRHRAVGHHGARRRSDLDAAALAALRRDDVHVLADSGRVPVRPRHRQQRRIGDGVAASTRPRVALGWCQLAAVRLHGVDGVRRSASRCRTGRSIRRPRPIRGSICRSTACARCSPCCRRRFSGAPASRSRWPPSPRAVRIRRGWSAASTPRTRSARSSDRSARACVLVAWIGTQHSQQVLMVVAAIGGVDPAARRRRPDETERSRGGRRRRVRRDPRRRAARAKRSGDSGRDDRVRTLREHARQRLRAVHLRRRGHDGVGRRVEAVGRRAQLSQRRQGAGLERAAGHAPAAHARPHDDAHSAAREARRRHRLRRRRHGRRRVGRSGGHATRRSPRSSRSCRKWSPSTSANTTSTSSRTRRSTSGSTMRGTTS